MWWPIAESAKTTGGRNDLHEFDLVDCTTFRALGVTVVEDHLKSHGHGTVRPIAFFTIWMWETEANDPPAVV